MPEHNTGTMGGIEISCFVFLIVLFCYLKGTMRLGRRTTHFITDDSIVSMYICCFI
jgi:hypothetical protein